MRIAFLTPWRIRDPQSWSGVVCRMNQALEVRAEIIPIETHGLRASLLDRAWMKTFSRLSQKRYLSGHSLAGGFSRRKRVEDLVRRSGADVVLAVAASQDIAMARFSCPVVQVTDATFQAMIGYYPLFSELQSVLRWQGARLAKLATSNTEAFAVASGWAKDSLVRHYGVPEARCAVVPFGPSCEPEEQPQPVERSALRILVVCSDWNRKGGDLAVSAVEVLREQCPDSALTVVGDAPALPEWVTCLGRVPRSNMPELYRTHDVLLELATANAGGVTLTDAHAFGLPTIATDTGGVGSIVDRGVTGLLVDPDGDVVAEAAAALRALYDRAYRTGMARAAYQRHLDLLNWDTWASDVLEVCRQSQRLARTISETK